jgi:hypothetical protein
MALIGAVAVPLTPPLICFKDETGRRGPDRAEIAQKSSLGEAVRIIRL